MPCLGPSEWTSLIPVLPGPLGAGQEDPWQTPGPPCGPERPAGHEDRVLQHQRDQAADGEAGGAGAAAVPHRGLGGAAGREERGPGRAGLHLCAAVWVPGFSLHDAFGSASRVFAKKKKN